MFRYLSNSSISKVLCIAVVLLVATVCIVTCYQGTASVEVVNESLQDFAGLVLIENLIG